PENRSQQVVRKMGVQRHSTLNISTQANLALDHDQRARLMLRKKIRCQHDVVVCIHFSSNRAAESQLAPESRQCLSNFRLENHYQRKDSVRQHRADQPIEGGEFAETCEIKS